MMPGTHRETDIRIPGYIDRAVWQRFRASAAAAGTTAYAELRRIVEQKTEELEGTARETESEEECTRQRGTEGRE